MVHIQSVQFDSFLIEHIVLVVDSQSRIQNGSYEVVMTWRPETLSCTWTLTLTINAFHILQIPNINISI